MCVCVRENEREREREREQERERERGREGGREREREEERERGRERERERERPWHQLAAPLEKHVEPVCLQPELAAAPNEPLLPSPTETVRHSNWNTPPTTT